MVMGCANKPFVTTDGLSIRYVQPNNYRIPDEESGRNASNV